MFYLNTNCTELFLFFFIFRFEYKLLFIYSKLKLLKVAYER